MATPRSKPSMMAKPIKQHAKQRPPNDAQGSVIEQHGDASLVGRRLDGLLDRTVMLGAAARYGHI